MTTLEETECLVAQRRETFDVEERRRGQLMAHLPDGASAPWRAMTLESSAANYGSRRLPAERAEATCVGEGPPDAYLAQARLAARFQGWSPEETAVRVARSLEALKILGDLLPHEQRDWAEIQGTLHPRFGQHVPWEDAREELCSRQQQEKEKLGAFAADLRQLSRQGYTKFTTEAQEELALEAFLRGVRPQRLRKHVRLASPGSLMAALGEAEHAELVSAPKYTLTQASASEDDVRTCRALDGPHKSDEVNGERADLAQGFPRRQRRYAMHGGCFRCGGPGHIVRYCPAPTPMDLVLQPQFKLKRGGIVGKTPPVASISSPPGGSNLRLGHQNGLYVDCGLDSAAASSNLPNNENSPV